MSPEQLVDEIARISNSINDLRDCQQENELKRERLGLFLESHMKNEEMIQARIMEAVEDLKKVVKDVAGPTHSRHHEFIDRYIEEQEMKRQFWCDVKNKVATGTIWAIMVGMSAVAVFAFKQWLRMVQG